MNVALGFVCQLNVAHGFVCQVNVAHGFVCQLNVALGFVCQLNVALGLFAMQVNVALSPRLRWPLYPGALHYNLYIWPYNTPQPTEPIQNHTMYTSYTVQSPFTPTQQILWQIEYIVEEVLYPSPVWGFTTRSYANLVVTDIVLPETAFSGQSFDIQWTVENKGNVDAQIFPQTI